jgi:hypothetical protein
MLDKELDGLLKYDVDKHLYTLLDIDIDFYDYKLNNDKLKLFTKNIGQFTKDVDYLLNCITVLDHKIDRAMLKVGEPHSIYIEDWMNVDGKIFDNDDEFTNFIWCSIKLRELLRNFKYQKQNGIITLNSTIIKIYIIDIDTIVNHLTNV